MHGSYLFISNTQVYICKNKNIPLVLGSATPDIATAYRAVAREVNLLKLTQRANTSKLPEISIVFKKLRKSCFIFCGFMILY